MRCVACGRPIFAAKVWGPPITLDYVWRHYSRWANRTHHAVPKES